MRLRIGLVFFVLWLGACVWSTEPDGASGPTGSIVVWQSAQQSGVSVSFAWTEPAQDPACRSLDDHCVYCLVQPDAAAAEVGSDEIPPAVRAGAIHVRSRFEQLALPPGRDGQYPSAIYPAGTTVFPADDTLWFTADGGADIAAFEHPLRTPATVLLTSPELGDSLAISLDAPLELSWTGGGDGEVSLFFEVPEPQPSQAVHLLTCSYQASRGQATIEPSQLQTIAPPEGSIRSGVMSYAVSTEQAVTHGDWTLRLRAQNTVQRAVVAFD